VEIGSGLKKTATHMETREVTNSQKCRIT